MHVLMYCVGSAGDVYPFIAVGQSLKRRGYDVDVLTAEPFRERIERAGLRFIAAGTRESYDEVVRDPDLFHHRKGARVILRRFAQGWAPAYELLLEHVRPGETVVVASTLGMAARFLQEKFATPLATVHLQPSSVISATDPGALAAMLWVRRLPVWAVRTLLALMDRSVSALLCPKLNAFRATIGLKPVRSVLRWMNSPECVICAFPDWYAAPQNDWPPQTVCTTFPRLAAEPDERLSDALEAFLRDGAPPVAFTPGSANAHGHEFFERALAVTQRLDARAVFVTRYREQLPAALPPTVHYEPYAPYDVLAPRVAAFVHHGGIGTSATVLAAGTPQLISPFAFDQPDNARRLKALGVARSVRRNASLDEWTRELSQLLADPAVAARCREVAATMASERPGSEQIADRIEAVGKTLVSTG